MSKIRDFFIEKFQDNIQNIVAAEIDGKLFDLSASFSDEHPKPVFIDSEKGLEILRHSTAHIMAQAVKKLFPDALVTIGPATSDGFYYDFYRTKSFTQDDLEKIENEMNDIIKSDLKFERIEMGKEEAMKLFSEMGEKYKVEIIKDIPEDRVSVYTQGSSGYSFTDLCRGPHIPSTGYVKAFKLLNVSGAYWRGDENKEMLQRIYGTAFSDKERLNQYLKFLDEAKKRDHRKLGKDLDLFSIQDVAGGGLVFWHPKGAIIRKIIEDLWKRMHIDEGYQLLYTPHIARLDLWKVSGHWDFYRENMFSPMELEDVNYELKPMNCPFHILVYKNRLRSYRELPIKYAELGTVYRFERAGTLHGLLRVRGFTQDDAHIFLLPEQLEKEILKLIDFTKKFLKIFGFERFEIYLSTRPERYVGTLKNWETAEMALKNALEKSEMEYKIELGEGVFYGPKIDIKIKDTLGRLWQCSTIQVDFNLPDRFKVYYIGEDNSQKTPIMIHRAIMGSLERFFGILIENYAGNFPLWLAPIQIIVIPVSEKTFDYAFDIRDYIKNKGYRVEIDIRSETLNYKIRDAEVQKIPYIIILGERERAIKTISFRKHKGGDGKNISIEKFLELLDEESKIVREYFMSS